MLFFKKQSVQDWFSIDNLAAILRRGRKRRPSTIRGCQHAGQKFIEYCSEKGLKRLRKLKKEHIQDFRTWLEDRGLAASSAGVIVGNVKACLSLAVEANRIKENCAFGIRTDVEPREIRIYSELELHKILNRFEPELRDVFDD